MPFSRLGRNGDETGSTEQLQFRLTNATNKLSLELNAVEQKLKIHFEKQKSEARKAAEAQREAVEAQREIERNEDMKYI
jgi:hypothetical protein